MKMFKKIIDAIDKVIIWIEKDRKKQAEKIRAKKDAYLAERRKEAEQENRKAIREELHKRYAKRTEQLGHFTTIGEFINIINSEQYKSLSEKEREIFLRRTDELRKKDAKFAADYQKWQSDRAEKRKIATTKRNTTSGKITITTNQDIYRI